MMGSRLIQPKLRLAPAEDVFEQEADRVAQTVVAASQDLGDRSGSLHTVPHGNIQRKCAKCEEEEEETLRRSPKNGTDTTTETAAEQASDVPVAETTPETPTPEQASAPSEQNPSEPVPETKGGATLLVEDDAEQVGPGQMRKSEFLAALRESVCATANEAMAPTGQTTENCPWMEYWFTQMADKDAAHVERVIRKYAPETAEATTARDYIPLVAARVRHSVEQWATSGEITGLPEGVTPDIPGLGVMGGMAAGVGGMFFKAKAGGPRAVSDVHGIRQQLGTGRPLPGGVRSRMESAFGLSFSQVRIHTDSGAASLSDQLNARAFTVGEHVAFGPGEYQPGSLVGDALLAHELAHVVQQGGATADSAPMMKGDGEYNTLEQDADWSAVEAVASIWGGARRFATQVAQEAIPALKSGLRLQRCGSRTPSPRTPEARPSAEPPAKTPGPGEAGRVEPGAEERPAEGPRYCATESDHPGIIALLTKAGRPAPSGTLAYGFTFWSSRIKRPKLEIDWTKVGAQWTGTVKPTSASMGTVEALYLKKGTHEIPGKKVTANFPQCGAGGKKVPFASEVSEEMSHLSRQAEQEHCDDYKRAFDLTYGQWVSNINSLAGTSFGPGTKAEVEKEIDKALKAKGDKGGDGWVAEFRRLAALSLAGRDDTRFHSLNPDGQPVSADAGCTKVIGTTVKSATTKVPGPSSDDLIK